MRGAELGRAWTLKQNNLHFIDMVSPVDQASPVPRLWFTFKSVWEWIALGGSYNIALLIVETEKTVCSGENPNLS